MNKNDLKVEILERAGKLFGIEIIIADDSKDESYIKGFKAGKEFMKKEILRLLKE